MTAKCHIIDLRKNKNRFFVIKYIFFALKNKFTCF
jgi:hypothetical protein